MFWVSRFDINQNDERNHQFSLKADYCSTRAKWQNQKSYVYFDFTLYLLNF